MGVLDGFIGGVLSPIKDIVSEVVVDKDKRDQVNLELKKIEDQAQARLDAQVTGQIEVNKVEAASGSVFVAGWRPAVGWVGAAGFGYSLVVKPFLEYVAIVRHWATSFPSLDDTLLITVMGGMLGIGTMRSFEKVRGVATNDYRATPAVATSGSNVEVDTKKGTVSVETTPSPVPQATTVAAPPKRKWSLS